MSIAKTALSKVASPKKVELAASQRWDLFPYLVTLLTLLTLLSLFHVWSRVKVVDLNLQITEANRLFKDLQQEKNALRLEVASLKHPARIESLAKGELGMDLPSDQQVIVVK
ncbi:MAG: cell division protein FtsL [Deltaproteobacteria bacterium]|nr:cell division protein FtsL [Deltaproteobacteria bacterium]